MIPFKVLIRNIFFSENWRTSLDNLELVSQNISSFLDCVELSKFESVPSEDQLEKRGLELIDTNKLWAGLVFVDVEEGMNSTNKSIS